MNVQTAKNKLKKIQIEMNENVGNRVGAVWREKLCDSRVPKS